MPTPLNPLIIARLRLFWANKNDIELGRLLYELDSWVDILGPGPNMPKCDNCKKELDFGWGLCQFCPKPICWKCYQCGCCAFDDEDYPESYEDYPESPGCCECGDSCGAYMCSTCKIDN